MDRWWDRPTTVQQGTGSNTVRRTRNVVSEKLTDWLTKASFSYSRTALFPIKLSTLSRRNAVRKTFVNRGILPWCEKNSIVTWAANKYSGNFHLKFKLLQVIQTKQSFTCVEFFNWQLNTALAKVVYSLLKKNPLFVAVMHVEEEWSVCSLIKHIL